MMALHEWPVFDRSVLTDTEAQGTWIQMARETGAIALIDKEEDWTSFDCVAKLRGAARVKKVGHAGTLDPLATGLLVVCFGKATKVVEKIQDADKEYTVTVKLGATTATDDRGSSELISSSEERGASSEPTLSSEERAASSELIVDELMKFIGELHQVPPAFSAIKHAGRPQYDLARKGKEFVNRPRVVTIHSIDNVVVEWPMVNFTMRCTKGTYVRSVARDLGERLGCGGYVWNLRRTMIGDLHVDNAVRISEFAACMAERVAA